MGKFVIKAVKNGVVFNLKAANGEVIATSQVYKTPVALRKGIASVMANVLIADIEDQTVPGFAEVKNPKFEIYQDKAGEYRFRLKAANGRVIAAGEGYKKLDSCRNGIESVRKNAPLAEIAIEE